MKRLAAFFCIAALFFLAPKGLFAADGAYVRAVAGQKSRDLLFSKNDKGGFSLFFYCGSCYYSLTLGREGRDMLEDAVKSYNEQFEKRRLKKKKPSSAREYGKMPVFLEWGSTSQKLDRESDSFANLGYVFVKQAPYFSITVQNSKSVKEQATPALQESGEVELLFTRPQLKALFDLLAS